LGNDTRRILIATVLSVAVVFAWQKFFAPPPPPPVAAPAEGSKPATPEAPLQAKAPPAQPAAPAPAPAPPPGAPEETVALESTEFTATLSSWGGGLQHLVLKGDKFRREQDGRTVQIDLVRIAPGQPYPLSLVASPELGGAADPGSDPAARGPMRITGRDARSVTFEGRIGALEVKKTIRLTGRPYELAVDLAVSGAARSGAVSILYPGEEPPDAKSGGLLSGPSLDHIHPVCRAGDKTERFNVDGSDAGASVPGAVDWVGLDQQHYFVSAILPPQPLGSCSLSRGPVKGSSLTTYAIPLEAGGRTISLIVYGGPKNLDTLRSYGRGFDTAIDYGAVANVFAFFARILLYVLRWLETLAHNWGISIILLTLIVKVAMYPLTAKQMRSMQEMKKLQPEIEKLKAKFGEDRERLNAETMKLYQQHKVNPLGGCLPMLIQLPIWFALYAALQTSVELYREPFLWLKDLTQHDPFYILPAATGIASFVTQKISPQPADSSQAKMMLYFMPALFTVMMVGVPGGLTLYIFVNSVLSIAQQQYMMRRSAAVTAPAKA